MHEFQWEIQFPSENAELIPSWLSKLRAMRGEVLFENGLRPSFSVGANIYDDPDEADFCSYHILAHHAGKIAGCLRLTPLLKAHSCASASMLGYERFSRLLQMNFNCMMNVVEVGRWLTHASYHHSLLGSYLGAAGIAIGEYFQLQLFAYVGRKAQHAIKLFGACEFTHDAGPYFIDKWQDSIIFLHFYTQKIPPRIRRQVEIMKNLLRIPELVLDSSFSIHNSQFFSVETVG